MAGLGGALSATGQVEDAARLLGASEGLLDGVGACLWPTNRPAYERTLATTSAQLGMPAFEASRAAGRALTLDDAVAVGPPPA